MKKILVAAVIVLLALGSFAGVAAARSYSRFQTGTMHDYMEKALAAKLNLPLATVESEFDGGKSLPQIALDHGVTQANLQTFMLEVRADALKAAVADGVLTQAQADRMLQRGGRGMGYSNGYGMMGGGTGYGFGMMNNGSTGSCNGSGTPGGGSMMQRGGRWQQTNP